MSAHAIGVSAPVAAFFFVNGFVGLFLIPFILVIGWARLELKVHTFSQVAAGTLFGFLLTLLQMNLLTNYI